MRRQALSPGVGGSMPAHIRTTSHDYLFYGPFGALNPSGDLILENEVWRERLFASVLRSARCRTGLVSRMKASSTSFSRAAWAGGRRLALNQLLVVMDGIDNPPFFKKLFTNQTNTFLDAHLHRPAPRREALASVSALPASQRADLLHRRDQRPVDRLDPALTRPGRMGRHVWFRTPTKQDRLDIFDLYLGKVAHEPELDQPAKREEIARMTNGYSPAMLEQVTSMALTIAHHSSREALTWDDLVEAMTTLEPAPQSASSTSRRRAAPSPFTRLAMPPPAMST